MARTKTIRHDPIVVRFAERLREQRRTLGLSQQELAFRAHVNVGYLGKLERGEAAPGLDMVGRLAQALSVSPTKLVGDADGAPVLATLKAQVRKKVDQFLSREDVPAIQSLAVLLALVDNALARRNT
jgi:transcriptional regulator with XRE-family HTH domain